MEIFPDNQSQKKITSNTAPFSLSQISPLPSRIVQTLYRYADSILKLIEVCNNEQSLDNKIQILYCINSSILPRQLQLNIPSLITDDYVDTALHKLETICGQIKWIASRRQINGTFSV